MMLVHKGQARPWLSDGDGYTQRFVMMAERMTFHRLLLELKAAKKLQLWDDRQAQLLGLQKVRWVREEKLEMRLPF